MDFFMICTLLLSLHRYIGICGALTNTPTKIHIGVLLEDPTQREEDIIALAVKQINESEHLLVDTSFSYDLKKLSFGNPYEVFREACTLLDDNITALVSSTSCESNLAIQSLAEEYNIPHFAVPKDKCSIEKNNSFTVSIRPSFEHQNTVLFEIIKNLSWIKVCIFYDSDIAFRNVEDLLTEASNKNYYLEVVLFRLEKNRSGELDTVSSLDIANKSSIKKMIVFCNTRNSLKLLQRAANHGMAFGSYKWIVTTQEFPTGTEREETEAAEELQFFNSTDTGILTLLRNQILIKNEPKDFLEAWSYLHPHLNYTFESDATVITPNPLEDIQITAAYLYDAIWFVATAVNNQIKKSWDSPIGNRCLRKKKKNTKWETGSELMNTVRSMSQVQGLTGPIYFPNTDVNINISMEILTIQRTSNLSSSTKIGTWDIVGGLSLTGALFTFQNSFLPNKTLRIVTIEEAPFVVKEDSVDGSKYTGFCIELIEKISEDLGFKYHIYDVPDNVYGVKVDGKWNGLIGQVYYSKADIALAGMIINSDREEVVDFTKPYMNYGVGILMKKPEEQRNVFAFLDPLAWTVWFSILAALFVVGIMVFILDRLSPYSSYRSSNRSPDVDDFNFRNSMWFAFASCMQQGGDNTPISISGRILSAAWWMFALIIIATYTANLAAFLTVTRMENPINSLEDLAYQKKVSYGTINGSSLQKYFEKRKHTGIYEILWNYMSSEIDGLPISPSPWVKSADEGYERVEEGNYAFFWDAPILDYIKQTECDMMTVGKPFNLKGYGIATAEGSPYRDKMSMAILKLQEEGELEDMRKRWFERESSCSDDQASIARNANANEIGLNKIAGAFYILIMGIVVSFIAVGIEHLTFNKGRNRKFDNKYESDWREVRTSRNNGILENSPHIVVRNDDSVVLSPLRPKAWNTSINSESAC